MFEIYKIPSDEQLPRKCIGHFSSPEQAMIKLGIDSNDMSRLLDGKISGGYMLEFDSKFMRDLALDSLINTHNDFLSTKEISQDLEMNEDLIWKHLNNAIRKIKKSGKSNDFISTVSKMKQIQRRRVNTMLDNMDICQNQIIESNECYTLDGFDIKVNIKAKVTIED